MAEVTVKALGRRLSDVDLAFRKAREASWRRHEAAGWLRKTAGKDFPVEPSEEDFRQGLGRGIVLCTALNNVYPGAVPKVIEPPSETVTARGGAYQYFENVRNFLDAVNRMGIPTFQASDLEEGGQCSRIVDCVLALKVYDEWRRRGGMGMWKYSKSPCLENKYVRRSFRSFQECLNKSSSAGEVVTCFRERLRELLAGKNWEDVEEIVDSLLNNVMEDFMHKQAANEDEPAGMVSQANIVPSPNKTGQMESTVNHGRQSEILTFNVKSEGQCLKDQDLIETQQRTLQDLKNKLHSTKDDVRTMQMEYQVDVKNLGEYLSGLAQAASGYHKVLEENRRLYNQVQDLKGNIRVYCRVRPFLPRQPNRSSIVEDFDERSITILSPSKTGKLGKKAFTFNKVFGPSATQEEVFADTQPLIRSVLDGYNVCIFAYGQTGSGKTYTMTGPKELTTESLGVNYRALNDLFLLSEERKDTFSYEISVQMIEIYNEQVRDLLSAGGSHGKKLEIRKNSSNGINVPNAALIPVTSTSDVIRLMNLGHENRAVGSTLMNDRSSRSHSCLTVHVQGRDLISAAVLRGCMHLVDLAGSERVDKTEATGERLKEAQHINRSLSALGDVIASLAQKQSHVPYRNSKLTQLLQDSLGGLAKTLMFVHISPEADALGETISTLKFAERAATVELGAARVNKAAGGEVKELKLQIADLKAALGCKMGNAAAAEDSCQAEEMSVASSPAVSRRLSLDSQEALDSAPPRGSSNGTGVRGGCSSKMAQSVQVDRRRKQEEMAVNGDVNGFCTATVATSDDSSEAAAADQKEQQRGSGIRNSSSTPNLVKRASPKVGRSPIPPQPPTTTRRLSNGRQPASVARKPARGT